jgi:hypothetical protein
VRRPRRRSTTPYDAADYQPGRLLHPAVDDETSLTGSRAAYRRLRTAAADYSTDCGSPKAKRTVAQGMMS